MTSRRFASLAQKRIRACEIVPDEKRKSNKKIFQPGHLYPAKGNKHANSGAYRIHVASVLKRTPNAYNPTPSHCEVVSHWHAEVSKNSATRFIQTQWMSSFDEFRKFEFLPRTILGSFVNRKQLKDKL